MANNTLNTYLPESVSIPGRSIQDIIDEMGMKQADLAKRMGIHTKTLNEIIKGKNPITPDTAVLLERVLKTPASFWHKREQQYQEYLARERDNAKLEGELGF